MSITNVEDDRSWSHVKHDYEDRCQETEAYSLGDARRHQNQGDCHNFPITLHFMLSDVERGGFSDVVSWQPHGRCFVIHEAKVFVLQILPQWFRQSKFASFQRQLNIYGFKRLTTGPDRGGYYHEFFLRGKIFLANRIFRMKIKGTGPRKKSSPEDEPNFYSKKYPKLPDDTNADRTRSMQSRGRSHGMRQIDQSFQGNDIGISNPLDHFRHIAQPHSISVLQEEMPLTFHQALLPFYARSNSRSTSSCQPPLSIRESLCLNSTMPMPRVSSLAYLTPLVRVSLDSNTLLDERRLLESHLARIAQEVPPDENRIEHIADLSQQESVPPIHFQLPLRKSFRSFNHRWNDSPY